MLNHMYLFLKNFGGYLTGRVVDIWKKVASARPSHQGLSLSPFCSHQDSEGSGGSVPLANINLSAMEEHSLFNCSCVCEVEGECKASSAQNASVTWSAKTHPSAVLQPLSC